MDPIPHHHLNSLTATPTISYHSKTHTNTHILNTNRKAIPFKGYLNKMDKNIIVLIKISIVLTNYRSQIKLKIS